jgi:hypothetical protein
MLLSSRDHSELNSPARSIMSPLAETSERRFFRMLWIERSFFPCLELPNRFGVILHGFVLMGNHYHLLLETPNPNLQRVMQFLNSACPQFPPELTK